MPPGAEANRTRPFGPAALDPKRQPARARGIWMGLVLAWVWFRALDQLHVEWSINPQYAYGWGVPFLAGYLFWKRWLDRPPRVLPPLGRAWPGLACLVASALFLALRLVQIANPDWRLVSWTYVLWAMALTFLALDAAGGRFWPGHFFWPVALILAATPWPSPLEQAAIQTLTRWVARTTVGMVHWVGIPASQNGNVIVLATGPLGLNEACSGVRSIQAMLMAAIFLGELYRFRAGPRLALVLGGMVAAMFFNVVRTFFLAWSSATHGAKTAAAWHDPAGYTVLGLTLAVLGMILLFLKGRPSQVQGKAENSMPPRIHVSTDRLHWPVLFIWILAAECGSELWYRSHERDWIKQPAWTVVWPKSSDWVFPEIPEGFQTLLRFNEAKFAERRSPDGWRWWFYFLRWRPGRAAAQLAQNHTPTVCLPATGLELEQDLGIDTLRVKRLELPYHRYVFRRNQERYFAFFCWWEERSPAKPARAILDMSRGSRLAAVREGRRNLGQQVIEVVLHGSPGADAAKAAFVNQLQSMIRIGPAPRRQSGP